MEAGLPGRRRPEGRAGAARRQIGRLRASLADRRGLARNLLFMIVWQGANYLAPLLTFPHLARTLQPAGFGQYGIYLLIGGWMTIASDWGTNYTGSRLVAQQNALTGNIDEAFWNVFLLRGAIVLALLGLVGAYLLGSRATAAQALLLLSAWTIILGNALTVSWCLQGLERLDAFATAAIVGRFATVPATILLVRHPEQVWVAVAIQGGGGIVIGLTSIVLLVRSRAITGWRWSWRGSLQQAREGFPVLVSTASHGLYSSTATAFLGIFQGAYATGLFVAADRVKTAAQGVIQPIGQALYPRISRLAVTDRGQAVRTLRLLMWGLGGTMVLGSLLLAVLAPTIMTVIAGPRFAASGIVLSILAVAVGATGLNAVLGWQTLMAFGFSKEFGRINLLAAIVNVAAMPGLVLGWGARGAAVGVLLTELTMLGCYVVVIARYRLLRTETATPAEPAAPEGPA